MRLTWMPKDTPEADSRGFLLGRSHRAVLRRKPVAVAQTINPIELSLD